MDYRARVKRVLRYIAEHLSEPLLLEHLAAHAYFSRYHFHRIFSAYVGETVSDYVRRKRLEAAADRLLNGTGPIAEIAEGFGYQTSAAFTKAFKRHYGIAPSAYRALGAGAALLKPNKSTIGRTNRRRNMKAEIRTLPEQRAYCITATGLANGNFTNAADRAFGELLPFLQRNGLMSAIRLCLGICPDDPSQVPAESCRYVAGVVLAHDAEPEGNVTVETIPGGRWAVLVHHGPYEELGQAWDAVYRDWLPSSGEQLRDTPPFEVYLNDKHTVAPQDLLTEIYIPIQ